MDFFKNDVNAGGSLNRGDTCYLNNVKQELFKGFTEAVERHNSCMDRHLKDLFDELQRHTASANTIVNKLGIDRVYEQKDAAEFYEKILSQTSDDASQIFHGELTHTTICRNPQCGTKKPTDSRFWHLPLSLTDSYSEEYQVVDGISDFFRDSHFSGLDQMFCEECDDKVDATVTCEVKHHPEVLVLLLKRFDFDYRYMRYVKNNRAVIVPFTLNVPENQTYELYAVVDHAGDLRGGHYAAVIKSQDDERWYNFNDRSVSLLDYQPFQLDHTERSHSAYLLFYRKQTSVTLDGRQTSAPVKYHGLLGHGETSYLNSLLQVLFMTREFREAVNRYIMTLRGLFDDLDRHTDDTCDFITKLVTTVFEPQEAAEYVQRISAPSMHQASQSQTTCCKCQTGRSRESSVWHLPLTLMDSNSEEYCLVDGLKQSLTDQVSCERCGSRTDVITKCEVKPHPEVLVLLLKRFDFDHCNMTYVINNRAVNITQTLQISENQTYELHAVVDHVGDLKGHHEVITSLNDGRWYNYYDNTHVWPFQHGDTERSQTVHLLFYRRQRTADTFSQDIREVFSCEGVLPATSDTNQSPHTETIRQREEAEGDVEEGDDAAETGSTGENKETQITVCVESTKPEAHVCNVENEDSGAGVRQREAHSDGNKIDEQEVMRHDEENRWRNGETDDLRDKTDTVNKDDRAEDQDEGVDDINDFNDGHLKYIVQKQYDMSSDQRGVVDEQTVDDEQSENLHREHEISEGADDVGLKIRQRVDNRDFTEGKSTDNELNVLPCEGVTRVALKCKPRTNKKEKTQRH